MAGEDNQLRAAAAALLERLRAESPAILMAEHVAKRAPSCSILVEVRFAATAGPFVLLPMRTS
jgi:hypothetical protein